MTKKEEAEMHIKKRRTTALKIIVDENTRSNELARRTFLGNVFDFPDYTKEEEVVIGTCTIESGDTFAIDEYMLKILQDNDIDPSTFKGYQKEIQLRFAVGLWGIDNRVRELTGITQDTYLHYKYSSQEENNGVTIYYLLFEIQTEGKTKTEIKGTHKANVCKLLNYLKMRKIPVSYDCEWEFEGNRACTL